LEGLYRDNPPGFRLIQQYQVCLPAKGQSNNLSLSLAQVTLQQVQKSPILGRQNLYPPLLTRLFNFDRPSFAFPLLDNFSPYRWGDGDLLVEFLEQTQPINGSQVNQGR